MALERRDLEQIRKVIREEINGDLNRRVIREEVNSTVSPIIIRLDRLEQKVDQICKSIDQDLYANLTMVEKLAES